MRSQTRLSTHLESGWTLEIPGEAREDPLTGNPTQGPPQVAAVSVSIQQRLLSGMTEVGEVGVVDERVAVILPPVEVPPDAVLISPRGEVWNAAGEGIIRRTARRKPRYTSVSVRRARERDR